MGLVAHGSGVGLAPGNQTVISTTVDVFDEGGNNIGFISQLNRNDTRPVVPIRHLDSSDAGRILELQPGPETYQLTATGYALYNVAEDVGGSLLNRLPQGAAAFKVMNDQSIPFTIEEAETHPATTIVNRTLFLGCMLNSYSKPLNIGSVTVTETAGITVSWVE